MALVTSRSQLSQGGSATTTDMVFASSTVRETIITSALGELPALAVDDFFEIRGHSETVNNGLYIVTTMTTSTESYTCDKVSGSDPTNAGSEEADTRGSTADPKEIFFDTAGLGIYALETTPNALDYFGLTAQAFYSFSMQEWKDDDFLIANAPFPLLAIDSDAGKYIVGQDASGNFSGWNFVDDADIPTYDYNIRTRKLMRNMGWNEVDSSGNILARHVGVVTLGAFEDETAGTGDLAYFQFGDDTTVDDTVDFDFTGPVNEGVKFYEEIGNPATFTYVDGGGSADSVTRASGSFITDGFKVGGQMTTRASTTSANDGTYEIVTIDTDGLTMTFATGSFNTGQADAAVQVSVDNDNAMTLRLRVRDADTNGKTFSQANLASAGKTILGNFVYAFPLANATDLKISATDQEIITTVPYVGASDHNFTDGATTEDSVVFTDSTNSPFLIGDEGNFITIGTGTNAGIYEIITYNSATNVDVDRAFPATESTITYDIRVPGMSLTYYAAPQSIGGLVDGPYDFGIIGDAKTGTSKQFYEFAQYQLRQTTDIDADSDDAIGRTMDGLMRFVGEQAQVGSTDGGLTYPINPDGGGTGVFIQNLASVSKNDVIFFDNTQPTLENAQAFPESIPVSLDFNATLENDTAAEADLFYDRTIRTTTDATFDIVAGTGASGTFTSTAQMPTLENGVGAYVRVSGLTGIDTPMNGVYQVTTETSTSAWDVTRYDGATIVDIAAAAVNIDENCVDTPDAIIVHTDASVTGVTDLTFADAGYTITGDGDPDLSVFKDGMIIEVESTTNNNGFLTVNGDATSTVITVNEVLVSEASTSAVITEIVSVVATSDFDFSYDFDGNTQGGRATGQPTYVKAKAIGQLTAQYTESTVQTISSGTTPIIPLVSQQERNVV